MFVEVGILREQGVARLVHQGIVRDPVKETGKFKFNVALNTLIHASIDGEKRRDLETLSEVLLPYGRLGEVQFTYPKDRVRRRLLQNSEHKLLKRQSNYGRKALRFREIENKLEQKLDQVLAQNSKIEARDRKIEAFDEAIKIKDVAIEANDRKIEIQDAAINEALEKSKYAKRKGEQVEYHAKEQHKNVNSNNNIDLNGVNGGQVSLGNAHHGFAFSLLELGRKAHRPPQCDEWWYGVESIKGIKFLNSRDFKYDWDSNKLDFTFDCNGAAYPLCEAEVELKEQQKVKVVEWCKISSSWGKTGRWGYGIAWWDIKRGEPKIFHTVDDRSPGSGRRRRLLQFKGSGC
jgi:hypothetical protein